MKRWIARGAAGMVFLLLAVSFLLAGCGQPSSFEGSRTSSQDGFWMEYAILDRTETADFSLKEGDVLQVSMRHTVGDVDLTVGKVGEEPVYTGSEQTDADFDVIIPKAGTYRVSVTGHKAKGSIFITLVRAVQPDEGTNEG